MRNKPTVTCILNFQRQFISEQFYHNVNNIIELLIVKQLFSMMMSLIMPNLSY